MYKIQHIAFLFLLLGFHLLSSQVMETTAPLVIDESKSTIRTRFFAPTNYVWVKEEKDSFAEFLNNFPLYPPNFPVRDFNAVPIPKQYNHAALLNIDVGSKDLQQCADAWMRLYAEYLWSKKKYDEIGFHFTSGQFLSWNDYKSGTRTKETGDRVSFHKIGKKDDSYETFREYLDVIFRYAGTISLDKEGVPVKKNYEIKPGDFLITPGSPGHSVFVVGRSRSSSGKYLYLLAESFMPAQDIHILRNTLNAKLSPWYELDINSPQTVTAKYIFKPTSIKRFHAIK